ncbi:Conserved_hypothetical protein [Hexamita inflata]|uniref:Uncharacterized protein n=1 Tax=Hexamita inflata TaxID=28002 RepID=A0AA86QL07_9EUKA|nr:Conserved hypothetical protein [Hexamita inflata]
MIRQNQFHYCQRLHPDLSVYLILTNNQLQFTDDQGQILCTFPNTLLLNSTIDFVQPQLCTFVLCQGQIYIQIRSDVFVLRNLSFQFVSSIPGFVGSYYGHLFSLHDRLFASNGNELFELINGVFQSAFKNVRGQFFSFCDNVLIVVDKKVFQLNEENMELEYVCEGAEQVWFSGGVLVLRSNDYKEWKIIEFVTKQHKDLNQEQIKRINDFVIGNTGMELDPELINELFGEGFDKILEDEWTSHMIDTIETHPLYTTEISLVIFILAQKQWMNEVQLYLSYAQ